MKTCRRFSKIDPDLQLINDKKFVPLQIVQKAVILKEEFLFIINS